MQECKGRHIGTIDFSNGTVFLDHKSLQLISDQGLGYPIDYPGSLFPADKTKAKEFRHPPEKGSGSPWSSHISAKSYTLREILSSWKMTRVSLFPAATLARSLLSPDLFVFALVKLSSC